MNVKRIIPLCILSISFFLLKSSAQQKAFQKKDSIAISDTLSGIDVNAFALSRKLSEQAAAISYIGSQTFNRYDDIDIVSAINTAPGVRVERRSPGSYRFNIRGSSLRSPFGVRNVKVYYDGIPITDPSGNTYTNQLGIGDYGSVEIIKGPSGSMYGAGTGGVVLIKSKLFSEKNTAENKLHVKIGGGSFGLKKGMLSVEWGQKDHRNALRYSEVRSEGYRDHTQLHHRIASYETKVKINAHQNLDAFFHYTDLYYQTPGALTRSQFDKDPRAARPAAGIFPSSAENEAAVHQKAFFTGLKHTYDFGSGFKNTTALYGSYTDFTNPTVRNYEFRKEPHFGGRTVFQYHHAGQKVDSRYWIGGEIQQGFFSQKDFGNRRGKPDTIMNIDRVNEMTALLFAQADFNFVHGWELNVGLSVNHRNIHFSRLYPVDAANFHKKQPLVLAPRIALSKKLSSDILVYGNASKGFSPPTVAEILPSTNVLNKNLEPEQGIQYELGSKGFFIDHKLYYDISLFLMKMKQSISLRRDSSEADHFVNAGKALKKGLEVKVTYSAYNSNVSFIRSIGFWEGLTLFNFKYRDYLSGDKDFSGKHFPGTAPLTTVTGIEVNTSIGVQASVSFQHTSEIPLDDANSVYASDYNLLGIHFSYQKEISQKIGLELSLGGNNLLNERYSLGNDINAFGGRYYNAAPTINFYGNIGIQFLWKKK